MNQEWKTVNKTEKFEWKDVKNNSIKASTEFVIPKPVWKILREKANDFKDYEVSPELRCKLMSDRTCDLVSNTRLMYQSSVVQIHHKKAALVYKNTGCAKVICFYSGIYSAVEGPIYFFLTHNRDQDKKYPWCLTSVLSGVDIICGNNGKWANHLGCDNMPTVIQINGIYRRATVQKTKTKEWNEKDNRIHERESGHIQERKYRLSTGKIEKKQPTKGGCCQKISILYKDKQSDSLVQQYLEPIPTKDGKIDGYYALRKCCNGEFQRATILSNRQAAHNMEAYSFLNILESKAI